MAKWGEGDPRWIVEERPDAVNVNNWHWTEKDATKWSEAKMRELLVGLTMKTDAIETEITELSKIEGEASVNNRKAKLIFLYDWNLTLTWKGRLLSSTADKSTGSINIPNLSDENTIDEVTVEVTLKDSTSEGEIIKQYLHMEGQKIVREQLNIYLKLLKEEFSKGVILPKKDGELVENKSKQINKLSEGFNQKMQVNNAELSSRDRQSGKEEYTSLDTSCKFQCTGEEIYQSLTDPKMVAAFCRGRVVVDPQIGGKFELFEGNISGQFLQLVPNKKIVKKWRLKSWPKDHYSEVTLNIDQQEDHTVVRLRQTKVPKGDVDVLKNNWELYYWNSIKQTFGFGYFL